MTIGLGSSASEWDAIACEYDKWFAEEPGKSVFRLESMLLLAILGFQAGESVLDVGCGTGRFLSVLLEMGADAKGIDGSPGMLEVAKERGLRDRAILGDAKRLPFSDKAFDYAVFFTSLEFIDDPIKALAEAARVTRKRVAIGFLNRRSIMGIVYRRAARSRASIYSRARFYSGRDIERLAESVRVGSLAGIRYGLFLPVSFLPASTPIEQLLLGSEIPIGGFGAAAFDVG